MALFRIIYTSRVARPVRFADVEAIAERAVARNTAHGLTGMLVYTPSHFIQVLEGDEAKVRETLARIRLDPRHTDLHIVDGCEIATREFDDWAMVARQLHGVQPHDFGKLNASTALALLNRARA